MLSFHSDTLVRECHIYGILASGFSSGGGGFFRLSAFGHRGNVIEAVERIKKNPK